MSTFVRLLATALGRLALAFAGARISRWLGRRSKPESPKPPTKEA